MKNGHWLAELQYQRTVRWLGPSFGPDWRCFPGVWVQYGPDATHIQQPQGRHGGLLGAVFPLIRLASGV